MSRPPAGAGLARGLVALALASALSLGTVVHAEPPRRIAIAVVVGLKSPLRSISLQDLGRLFSGKAQGRAVIPLNRTPRSPIRIGFDRAVLRMGPEEVGRYWVDRGVRGESDAPRAIDGATTVTKLVARFPEALGYVRADEVPSTVRVLRIDGRDVWQPDYPLWFDVPR